MNKREYWETERQENEHIQTDNEKVPSFIRTRIPISLQRRREIDRKKKELERKRTTCVHCKRAKGEEIERKKRVSNATYSGFGTKLAADKDCRCCENTLET